MATISLTNINDGVSAVLDAVDVEWHVCLGNAGGMTACEYGTGTITAGELEIVVASEGDYTGTLMIVGSTEMRPITGTASGLSISAPVITSIDPQDSSLSVNFTHAGFDWAEFFNNGAPFSPGQFYGTFAGGTGVKLLTGLTNGVEYTVTMQANLDTGEKSLASNAVAETPVGTNTAPVITLQPNDSAVTAGSTANFLMGASGTPAPTLQWQHDLGTGTWTNIAGATTTGLSVTTSDTSKTGWKYKCIATNIVNSAETREAILTVSAAGVGTLLWESSFTDGILDYVSYSNVHPGGGTCVFLGGEVGTYYTPGDGTQNYLLYQNINMESGSIAQGNPPGRSDGQTTALKTWYRPGLDGKSFQKNTAIIVFPAHQDVYVRLYVKWSDQWIWPGIQHKFCKILYTGPIANASSNGFGYENNKMRVTYNKLSIPQPYLYPSNPNPIKEDDLPGTENPAMSINTWYEVQMHAKMSDPGQANGELEWWLNGVQYFGKYNLENNNGAPPALTRVELMHVYDTVVNIDNPTGGPIRTMPCYMKNIKISTAFIT